MNTKVTFEFNAEKYKAIEKFSEKKGINIQQELSDFLDKTYKKIVPPQVREYIEE